MKHLLFCGGGSAGHVVPNLAVMQELRGKCRLTYAGSAGGIEERLAREAGYPFFGIPCPKLVRSLTPKNLTLPFRMAQSERRALALLKELRPDLVFSKGGYASLPYLRAANKLHIPALTHESDLSPGLATRLAAGHCKLVLTSFAETARRFANGRCVGSPMRKELFAGSPARARTKYGFTRGKPVLLVLGGGSGSRTLNEAVRAHLPALLETFQIVHLRGSGGGNPAPGALHGYKAIAYEPDMASAYAAADLVLSRAGSNTVFEALALKKPALFVPLERASRGDQLENARHFEALGLCRVLREGDLSALPEALSALLRDEALAARLKEAPIKNGTPAVIEAIRETVGPL